MKIAIKNPAPVGNRRWGDYHFGIALQRALESKGVTVHQHFWPNWDRDDGEDVVLVLRGKRRYRPKPGKRNLLWVISHPVTVSVEEINEFSRVFLASDTHRDLVKGEVVTPVSVMRQCTDDSMFNRTDLDDAVRDRRDIVFVANSRGVKREIVAWAVASGIDFKIVGRHWGRLGLNQYVSSEYIDNEDLPGLYRRSRLSLNDHWGDMAYFGMINNRVFDCLACGLPILSDDFPELRKVCGEGLLYASNQTEFWRAIREYTFDYQGVVERTASLWDRISAEYTFSVRADQIISEALSSDNSMRAKRCSDVPTEECPPSSYSIMDRLNTLGFFNGGTAAIGVMHVFPKSETALQLSSDARFDYLSGGFGSGPWHVPLDIDWTQIAKDFFDVLVFDSWKSLAQLGMAERENFIIAGFERVKPSGFVIHPNVDNGEYFRIFAENETLRMLDRTDDWSIWQKRGRSAA